MTSPPGQSPPLRPQPPKLATGEVAAIGLPTATRAGQTVEYRPIG
ncbi:MAG: hypothetical protein VKK80_07060 [Prochlorothrix sp.]|nr:hypothetical protein [Prochlorothrix sp.]